MLIALAFSGCASSAQDVQPGTTTGNEIGGYNELVDGLRAAGATVEPAEEVEQPFFSVKAQKINVDGAKVQVFEYSDEAALKVDMNQISPYGSTIGTSMITWVDQPNFWAKGRIIVLCIGKDESTVNLLSSVLGDPITKPQ